jgi:hypothetical protein
MIFTPGSGPQSQAPPQPQGSVLIGSTTVLGRTDSASQLDALEPRMFPGIVSRSSRRRGSSNLQRGSFGLGMSEQDSHSRKEGDLVSEALEEEPLEIEDDDEDDDDDDDDDEDNDDH